MDIRKTFVAMGAALLAACAPAKPAEEPERPRTRYTPFEREPEQRREQPIEAPPPQYGNKVVLNPSESEIVASSSKPHTPIRLP